MFVVDQSPTFNWPVEFDIPGDGKPLKVKFTAKYKRLPQSRVDAMLESQPSDDAVVQEVFDGWGDDVKDEEGHKLEFNAVNLNTVLEVAGARRAIARTFFEAMLGEAKRKN